MGLKIYMTTGLLTLATVLPFSCDRELEVRRDFDFEVRAEKYRTDMALGETRGIILHIESEGNWDGTAYGMSVFLREGEGTLSDGEDNVLEDNRHYGVYPGRFELYYTPHEKGTHKIEIVIDSSTGKSREMTVELSVED